MKLLRAAFAVLVLPSLALAQEGKTFEKTVKAIDGPIPLGFKSGKCTVVRVTPKNYPDPDDISHARNEDRDDKAWLWWEFYATNDGDRACHVEFWIDLLDKAGKVVKSSERSGKLDHDERDDEFRVSTLARTLDIVDGRARVKVRIRQ
jgi:ribosomal protein S10